MKPLAPMDALGGDFQAELAAKIRRGRKMKLDDGFRVAVAALPHPCVLTPMQAVAVARQLLRAAGLEPSLQCPGHGHGGMSDPCCPHAGYYSGYGSDGPRRFTCPKGCSCHD